jgi:hypothetical protein
MIIYIVHRPAKKIGRKLITNYSTIQQNSLFPTYIFCVQMQFNAVNPFMSSEYVSDVNNGFEVHAFVNETLYMLACYV